MNFLDRKRVEIECVCGGKGVHLVADVYVHKTAACRLCRRVTKLDGRKAAGIAEHMERAADEVLQEMRGRRGE